MSFFYQGGFSLAKVPSFTIQILDCKIHPQRRLTIRVERVQLKYFALCGARPKASPLDTTNFLKKVRSKTLFSPNFLSLRRRRTALVLSQKIPACLVKSSKAGLNLLQQFLCFFEFCSLLVDNLLRCFCNESRIVELTGEE